MIFAKLKAVIKALNKICDFLLGIDMVVIFLVLLLQIFSRFLAFIPIPWSQDLIVFLLVVSVFLGVCTATANGKQIRLEFFVDLLPKKITSIILIFADIVSILFLGVITKQAFQLAGDNMGVIVGASPVGFGWYYAVVALGAAVMLLNFVCLIIDRVMALFPSKGNKAKEDKA